MKRQTETFNKKIGEQKRQIDETANCVQEERQNFNEDVIDMRDTLICYNIPEVDGENCKDKLLQFCEFNLKMDDAPNKIKIEQANRMGKQGPRNRPIIAKLSEFSQRQEVRKSAINLNGTEFGISEQLPGEVMKRRKTLQPNLKELRNKNIKAHFVRDKIYINGE